MLETVLLQAVFKLFIALMGIIMGRMALVWMDRRVAKGGAFGEWLQQADDHAKAIYYSGRIVGVMLVVGLALS